MKYHLAEASKNTFILFDCLQKSTLEESFLQLAHLFLTIEGRDDALILMQGSAAESHYKAHMAVWGLDGTFGEFCGNGALVCAAYLFKNYPHYKEFSLLTRWGEHSLKAHGAGVYSIQMPLPSFTLNPKFITSPPPKHHYYVEAIEPHLVIPQQMNEEQLLALGRELNARRDLFPLGINVNAYHLIDEHSLRVKTYERGARRLTEACGTGSMACGAWHLQNGLGALKVLNRGGILELAFHKNSLILKGAASYV